MDNFAFVELCPVFQDPDSTSVSRDGTKQGLEHSFAGFTFTQDQLEDLEDVYTANPWLEFAGRDILADAFDVTEDMVNLWFRRRRLNDLHFQQEQHTSSGGLHRSSITAGTPSPRSEMECRNNTMPPPDAEGMNETPSLSAVCDARATAVSSSANVASIGTSDHCSFPPWADSSDSSTTATATYTSASLQHDALHGPQTPRAPSFVPLPSVITCHPAPVSTCRDAASLKINSGNSSRPAGSACLSVRYRTS